MAYIQPTSEVWLCSNVPLDPSYDNTLTFTTTVNNQKVWDSAAQRSYFASKAVYHPQNFSIVKERDGVLRMSGEVSKFYNINYMFFVNPTFEPSQLYSGKYFYAFVTQVEEVNPNTTFIYFELDYYQTWAAEIEFMESVIEREHVSDDSMYKNLEDEGINIQDTMPYEKVYLDKVLGQKILVVGASKSYEQVMENMATEGFKIVYNPFIDYPVFDNDWINQQRGPDVLHTVASWGFAKATDTALKCYSNGVEVPYKNYSTVENPNNLNLKDINANDVEINIYGATQAIDEVRFTISAYYLLSNKFAFDMWFVKCVNSGGKWVFSRDGIRILYNPRDNYPNWTVAGNYNVENVLPNQKATKLKYIFIKDILSGITGSHFIIGGVDNSLTSLTFDVTRNLLSDAKVKGELSGGSWTFTDGS